MQQSATHNPFDGGNLHTFGSFDQLTSSSPLTIDIASLFQSHSIPPLSAVSSTMAVDAVLSPTASSDGASLCGDSASSQHSQFDALNFFAPLSPVGVHQQQYQPHEMTFASLATTAVGGGLCIRNLDELGHTSEVPRKGGPKACQNCKRIKVKCNFQPGSIECDRCIKKGCDDCRISEPKKRAGLNTRETLQREMREKDRLIATLLRYISNTSSLSSIDMLPNWGELNNEQEYSSGY
ncbi:hypothetical protein BKA62DRAFT_773051 [Auriculariales sp. MPI-PUGE-AT-0066]|nr:hypothetical protein BKA62DRAFT_773051 [Auriculariales sp. MPI-PUGE-AT-0066]